MQTQNIMTASHQWATRPADQRYLNLIDMKARFDAVRNRSVSKVLSTRAIHAAPVEGDSKALMIVGPNGAPVNVTNWAFGQLAARADAPSGYLRSLPGALAADNLNYGLRRQDVQEIGLLLHKAEGESAELRAATGPNYGRVWMNDWASAIIKHLGDGVNGNFRVPGEFGVKVPITKENTTLYASDRDGFVFLADEDHRIEVPNRRGGKFGTMARGLIFWNSEVGSKTIGMAGFLYDYVCSNRIIWGATGYREVSFRHTSGAPDRWIEEAVPAIEAYANQGARDMTQALIAAQAKKVQDVDAFLGARFTKSQVTAIKVAHMTDEDRPIESLWDVATAATAYARSVTHQDERVKLERIAGKVLDLAA